MNFFETIKSIRNIWLRVKKSIELNKYNDFTIAEYFRKQGARIGENNRIEIRSLGPEPYLIKIGDHCTIAPGASFLTHDGGAWIFTEEIPSLQRFGTIEIFDNCFIGLGAIILLNTKIGPNSIVGAGSVVTKDVPANTIVGGNPARVISTIEEYKKKVIQIWKDQKPRGYFHGIEDRGILSPDYIQEIKYRDIEILRKHLNKLLWNKK